MSISDHDHARRYAIINYLKVLHYSKIESRFQNAPCTTTLLFLSSLSSSIFDNGFNIPTRDLRVSGSQGLRVWSFAPPIPLPPLTFNISHGTGRLGLEAVPRSTPGQVLLSLHLHLSYSCTNPDPPSAPPKDQNGYNNNNPSSPRRRSGTSSPHVISYPSVREPGHCSPSLDCLPALAISPSRPLLRLYRTGCVGDVPSRELHSQRTVTPRERCRETERACERFVKNACQLRTVELAAGGESSGLPSRGCTYE